MNNIYPDDEMHNYTQPQNGEPLGQVNISDIFSVSVVHPLIEDYEMPVGLYLLGNAGGMIGAGIGYEILNNYDIQGIDLRFYAINSARVDFSLLIRRFPPQLRDKLRIIPVGVKEADYIRYLELFKKKKMLEYKLAKAKESNTLPDLKKLQYDIHLIKHEIKMLQKKLSGSGSLIDSGLSKFQESYSLLERYFSEKDRFEDAQMLIGSFAGGTGSALFVEMSKLLKQLNRDSLRIAYGLAPFKSERRKNSLRVQNYIKSVQGTRPNVNLLIETDPTLVSEQLEKHQSKKINFMDLNLEFGRKNAQFLITLMLTNKTSEFAQVTQDFMDLKRIVGDNAVGDLSFYNNKTANGGYMSLIDTVKQKLIPDMIRLPSRVLIYYDIPKGVTVREVEQANNLITENTDAIVYFGVTQRINNEDKEIRLYTVAIRDNPTTTTNPMQLMDETLTTDETSIDDIAYLEEF